MIPIPLSFAINGAALAVALVIAFYEGIPLFLDGRVDRAYENGRLVERQTWEEQRRRALAAQEETRRSAQATIDAAEADYWRQSEIQKTRITELEKAIAAEPSEKPVAGADVACPPALSRRLRDAIDAAGR